MKSGESVLRRVRKQAERSSILDVDAWTTGARRGRRRLWLGVPLALLLAFAGVTAHPAPAFAEVDPGLVTTALSVVTVHSGARATFSFRVDDAAGGPLTVDLVVERAGGVKCARSWRYFDPATASPDFPDVTPRDAAALRELRALGRGP